MKTYPQVSTGQAHVTRPDVPQAKRPPSKPPQTSAGRYSVVVPR